MLLENINEVIKASPAIQIQGKMTHLQRRAWNVLLANAYNELPDKDIHSVGVAELASKLGYESNDLDYLKETLEALGACQVKWNLLNKDKKEKWGFANLLASADIENGICTYSFAAHLRPETSQSAHLYETQPTPAKPIQGAIRPDLVGSLF